MGEFQLVVRELLRKKARTREESRNSIKTHANYICIYEARLTTLENRHQQGMIIMHMHYIVSPPVAMWLLLKF